MIKAVLDTNVIISALLNPDSEIAKIVYYARSGRFMAVTCDHIISELRLVLAKKFHRPVYYVDSVIREFLKFVVVVGAKNSGLKLLKDNQGDNEVLKCAMVANADYLVSGDKKHILPLGKINGCKIVSAKEFIEIITRNSVKDKSKIKSQKSK
jgi:putative PIN family toxin of toxin-antitoxin system